MPPQAGALHLPLPPPPSPGRGVGEPLNETGLDGNGLIIRGTHRLSLDTAAAAPAQRRAALGDLAFPPLKLFAPLGASTPASWTSQYAAQYTGLAAPVPPQLQVRTGGERARGVTPAPHVAPLPPPLQVLTVHSWGPSELLVRVAHSYEAADGPALSANATLGLAGLFASLNLTDITEMTLTANRALTTAPT